MITVCAGKNLTDDELKEMKLERPSFVKSRWSGIAHYDLIKTLEERMDAANWKFEDRKISVDKTGFDMVWGWNVHVPGIDEMEDQVLAIGFQHSNRCLRSLRLIVGSTVFVCTNGFVSGQIVLAKKHTINLSLSEEIDAGLVRYVSYAKELKTRSDAMKETEIDEKSADHILMEAGRNKLIGWPTLGQVSKEFLHPTYADNGSMTAWGLYNAFTHVIKKVNVNHQLDLMYRFQQMMPVKQIAAV